MHKDVSIGYVILCLIVPLAWGLASSRVFDWWQARKRSQAPSKQARDCEDSKIHMYHI